MEWQEKHQFQHELEYIFQRYMKTLKFELDPNSDTSMQYNKLYRLYNILWASYEHEPKIIYD